MRTFLFSVLCLLVSWRASAQPRDQLKPGVDPDFRPELVGVEFSSREVRPDTEVAVTYRFRNTGTKPARGDYRVFVHLEHPRQDCACLVANLDHLPTVPTSAWFPGEEIADGPHVFRAPAAKGDADYFVHVGIYAPQPAGGPRLLATYSGQFRVSSAAPPHAIPGPDPLPTPELVRRRQALADRLREPLVLATDAFAFRLDRRTLAFDLTDKASGAFWYSDPDDGCFATVALQGPEGRANVAVRACDRIVERKDGLTLAARLRQGEQDTGITLSFLLDVARDPDGLRWRYQAEGEGEWKVESVTMLEKAFATTEADEGYLVEPRRLGERMPVAGTLPRTRALQTYSNITMAMYGLVKRDSGLLLAWPHPETIATSSIDWPRSERLPGARRGSVAVTLYGGSREFGVYPVGRGGYVAIGRAYRSIARRHGWLRTWAEKRAQFPSVDRMFGAADFKPFVFVRTIPSKRHPGPDERVHVGFRFDETAECARHWREDLGIDRAMVVLAGWIHRGYDNQHPDILPAAPECGGDEALARAAEQIRAQGYLFGLHDNYQDLYRDAPSWDESLVNKNSQGQLKEGGCWAGGQAYQVCAIKQVELAQRPRNLPAVRDLFGPTVYFIDTVFAWPLVTCEDPAHPMTRYDDMLWKSRLCDVAKEHFGLFGSEEGREWAVPHADYLEGLMGHKGEDARQGRVIPLFELVYGDCVNINTHQSDRLGPGSARYMLDHVLYAEMPVYQFGNHLYWRNDSTRGLPLEPLPPVVESAGELSFRITYRWRVLGKVESEPRCFVHFTHPRSARPEDIAYQDDHALTPAPTTWRPGSVVEVGPHTVAIPPEFRGESQIMIGLSGRNGREILRGITGQKERYHLGSIRTTPEGVVFAPAAETGADSGCFARADQGWGSDLCAHDRTIKNTYEVLSHLNRLTAETPMTDHAFVTADHRVERSAFGEVRILANYGPEPYEHEGTVLPAYGFLVESPIFVAFHAIRHRDIDYGRGALFTLRSLDGRPLAESRRVRVFHGFGPTRVRIGDREFDVEREAEVAVAP